MAAFKVSPRQAESIEAIAREAGVAPQTIAAAAQAAGATLAGGGPSYQGSNARQANYQLPPAYFGSSSSSGGGGGFANTGAPVSAH